MGPALLAGVGFAGELDGTKWKARPGGWGAILFRQSDTLKFDEGRFESVACVPPGFSPGPYEIQPEPRGPQMVRHP